jgi:predicted CXXCH cytochrome family protein
MAPRVRPLAWLAASAVVAAAACSHAPSSPPRGKVDFLPIPAAEAAAVENPHDFRGGTLCQRCHVRGEERPSVDPMTLCVQCHDPTKMRHPMGIPAPGGAGGLPLVEGTEIACHTCHDPHDVKAFPHGLRSTYAALCLNCHQRH